MNFASNYTYINSKTRKEATFKPQGQVSESQSEDDLDLNVFVVTFEGTKTAEKQLSGGDPYNCKQCGAILNKHSKIIWSQDLEKGSLQAELAKNETLWVCEFCSFKNILKIEKEQIPLKDDVVYMMESEHMDIKSENDSTIVFCIDTSGSMNTTSAIEGKVELKYGISKEELEMLKQFMEPGDEAQLNFLPGAQNHNKTFISRIQCILSAIESQINEIKVTHPHKKIGFVTFGSEVTALGDSKSETINIVGDKLYTKQSIVNAIEKFKLSDSIIQSHNSLLKNISNIQAHGQTALGPALISSLEIAEKGSPGSSVILCTDGLANIGVGQLQPYDQTKKQFYAELGEKAKSKNITVNIITIKGQGCKIEAIGQLAEMTNGNIKIVNPQKLSEDFANVLKDEVVGLNVVMKVLLHKAMKFRNQAPQNLKDEGCVLQKVIANATKNTRISFEYDVRSDEELEKFKIDLKQLKKIPFQAQIEYTSPTGGKFLRVVSCVCDTTEEKAVMQKEANLGVVHHRITNQTAALYKKGNFKGSQQFNSKWSNYLGRNFQDKKFQAHQNKFAEKNQRLNKAIKHRHRKSIQKKVKLEEAIEEEEREIMMNHSDIESDEDQRELVDNLMERQAYSIEKSHSNESRGKRRKSLIKKEIEKKEKRKRERSGLRSNSSPRTPRSLSSQKSGSVERQPRARKVSQNKKALLVAAPRAASKSSNSSGGSLEKKKELKDKKKVIKRELSPMILKK